MKKSTYHITTAIPYVNAKPHLGHILEWFQADCLARYQKLLGKDVSFTSGADENSLKNVQAAQKAHLEPQAWLDKYSDIFKQAYDQFNIELTGFRRGSDQELHWPGVQKLWQLCDANGDIYKKQYTGLYCLGCESFYTEAELIDGRCPEHPNQVPETITEENYFFKLSKYQDKIRNLIETNELTIVSEQFRQEMLGFIALGLEDFSISRSVERARGVGVPVPHDDSQVMYVWFDALTIYMTAIGWGYDQDLWQRYWPADVHIIGKGINRFHSIYWIGMLLSAGLSLPKAVSVHGYITANGQKMSKSLGNVIDPYEVVQKYGLEPVRFYLLKYIPTHSDGDFSHERFVETYTADLSNGLGNLCSRVAKLCEKNGSSFKTEAELKFDDAFTECIEQFEISDALNLIWEKISQLDGYLSEQKPWTKNGDEQTAILQKAVFNIQNIAYHLQPCMPQTAATILHHFSQPNIQAIPPLFPRLSNT